MPFTKIILTLRRVVFTAALFLLVILCIPYSYSCTKNTSALTYSGAANVSFTFNPILSISLSNTNINIDNLLPGLSSESSPITVSVGSNTSYGYSLFASVGNSTDYDTTDLIHEDNNTGNNAVFTSIATDASLPQLTTDNTWGYSLSSDNGVTWSNYNGLPLYSTVGNNTSTNNPALLIDTKEPAASTKSVNFRIAAKASTTQPSGSYGNVINFYAVGKPKPMEIIDALQASGAQKTEQGYYKMQDLTAEVCSLIDVTHSTATLQDMRDNNKYRVAKLKDGKCWMTENLNIFGGTEITSELSDIPENYVLPTSIGFQSGNRLPSSSAVFDNTSEARVYNSYRTENCGIPTANTPCYSYYSWVAATASSNTQSNPETDAPYSICPKGWKLPSSKPTSVSDWKDKSDYYKLAVAYGMNPEAIIDTSAATGAVFYNLAGPNTVPNFLLSGCYQKKSYTTCSSQQNGSYWSSTPQGVHLANIFIFHRYSVVSSTDQSTARGYAIRCIAK